MMDVILFLQACLGLLVPESGDVQMAIAPLVGAAAISAASSIGNAIFGGLSARSQRKKQLAAIKKAKQDNRNWYDRKYNEDATKRADAQRMMTRANEEFKKRNQAAAGRKAVTGGTDATLATTQQANAEAVGNALSTIAVNGENRKDAVDTQYRNRRQQLYDAESAVETAAEEAKRNNVATAATGAMNAMASVAAGDRGDKGGNKDNIKAAGTVLPDEKGPSRSIFDNPELVRENYWG